MKNHFLLLSLLLLLSVSAAAQKGTVGVKAGLNYSTAHFANVEGVDEKAGIVAGVFAEAGKREVRFQLEILYSREGFKTMDEDLFDINVRLNYINIPLMVKVYPVKWLSLDVGYQAGILWNAVAHKTSSYLGNVPENTDVPGMRSVNNSLLLGITFRLGEKVDLSARYNLGISDLANKKEGDMFRSRVGQFTLGYRF